jgi:hypothetical protein
VVVVIVSARIPRPSPTHQATTRRHAARLRFLWSTA